MYIVLVYDLTLRLLKWYDWLGYVYVFLLGCTSDSLKNPKGFYLFIFYFFLTLVDISFVNPH